MMRTFVLNLALMGGLFLLWYSYAPIDHKMRLPIEVRQAFSAMDDLATSGMYRLTNLVDGVSNAPPRLEEGEAGPLLIGGKAEGLEIHGELDHGRTAFTDRHPDMFAGLSLHNATLAESRLDKFNLDFTDMRGAALANVTLHLSTGQDTRFDGALIYRSNFSGASLRRARFDQAIIAHAVFEETEIIEGSFAGAIFRGGSLSGSTMTGSRFDDVQFERTDLRQVDFGASSFAGARFENARIHGASLAAANLSGANLSSTLGLTQDQLDQACGDEDTRLPEGLTIAPCVLTGPTQLAQF
ncbi:MAG: pentapeptide repeat-containing protein [Pseudomonadota bacterium]